MINKIRYYFRFIKWKRSICKHICLWCKFRNRCVKDYDYELTVHNYWGF